MRLTKLTATLFATTMVAMAALPEATLGAGQVARFHEQKTQKAKTERDSLANPAQAFAAAAAPGNMNHALAAAAADAASAAHGMPLATDGDKAAALHAVVHSAAPADDPHKLAIRKALGLTADPADTPKLNAFEQAAQDKLVHPGMHAGVVAFRDAVVDPGAALANGTPLDVALRAASADGASAATGIIAALPGGTVQEKIRALQAIEAGAAAPDNAHRQAIRTSLGLKADAASLHGGSPETRAVLAFHNIADERLVLVPELGLALGGIGGAGLTPQQKLAHLVGQLNAATHNATTGAPLVAGPAPTIAAALARAGL